MAKSEIKIEKVGGDLKVRVEGVIDEDLDFKQFDISGGQVVNFHLERLKSINSCGIREWIKWLGQVPPGKVVYHECPKVFIDQINMVQGFLPPQGRVESFFVPYYSEQSGEEKNILFSHGKEFDDKGVHPPDTVKDSAGADMEMDVIESKYFKFVARS